MSVDQDWVNENIDLIMKTFCEVHPQMAGKGANERSRRCVHKKKMLNDMDTLSYRPIYELTLMKNKNTKLSRIINRKCDEINHLETCIEIQKQKSDSSKVKFAHDFIVDEFGEKSSEYEKFISSYKETFGSSFSSASASERS